METLKIIKIGGRLIDNTEVLNRFLTDLAQIKGPKILVHGGGALATQLAQKKAVEVRMVEGRRITDADTLDIITMVYAGQINKNIVAKLQAHGCNAIGLTGADGNSIKAVKRPVKDIDYGFVGDVVAVNHRLLKTLIENGLIPVFCAITHDKNGQLLNTNADTVAAELAIACAKIFSTELFYCFEKSGLLHNVNDKSSVIKRIKPDDFEALKSDGIISGGMIPKLTNCFHALNKGVSKVYLGKPDMLFNPKSTYTTLSL